MQSKLLNNIWKYFRGLPVLPYFQGDFVYKLDQQKWNQLSLYFINKLLMTSTKYTFLSDTKALGSNKDA